MPEEEHDEEFDKAIGQYRLALNGLLQPLRMYGQGAYVDQTTEELVHLGIQLHLRLYGVEIPFDVRRITY